MQDRRILHLMAWEPSWIAERLERDLDGLSIGLSYEYSMLTGVPLKLPNGRSGGRDNID